MNQTMDSPEYLMKVIDFQFELLWNELVNNGTDFPINEHGESAWTYLNNIKYVLDDYKSSKQPPKPCICGKWTGNCKCN
jgi:hypothetical protein